MIADVLLLLRDRLNAQLKAAALGEADSPGPQVVDFIDSEKPDAVTFKLGTVSMLLINVEEEKALRAADPYLRVAPGGTPQRARPDVCLNLYVLFVARFKAYEVGLRCLSSIIAYFQSCPVFDSDNAPELGGRVSKLVVELLTLPLSEQNDLWGALRAPYQPCLLYRVKTVILRDDKPAAVPVVKEKQLKLGPRARDK